MKSPGQGCVEFLAILFLAVLFFGCVYLIVINLGV